MYKLYTLAACYVIVISIITSAVTVIDKIKAKKHKRRISEKSLFILALLGGSVSEYITMRIIRHKTLHKRFMIGLPCIFISQLIFIICFILYENESLPFFIL